jgi:uncharacterized protein YbjQ (UPF0145 family)
MDGLLVCLIPLGLLILGLAVGRVREHAHFRSIQRREAEYASRVVVTNLKRLPPALTPEDTFLCVGSVVIAQDYWKTWVAGLKHIIGGRLRTIETLVERARREAVLRMVEAALQRGATHVLNVRMETSTITRGQRGSKAGGIEVLAYGTGIRARA